MAGHNEASSVFEAKTATRKEDRRGFAMPGLQVASVVDESVKLAVPVANNNKRSCNARSAMSTYCLLLLHRYIICSSMHGN